MNDDEMLSDCEIAFLHVVGCVQDIRQASPNITVEELIDVIFQYCVAMPSGKGISQWREFLHESLDVCINREFDDQIKKAAFN